MTSAISVPAANTNNPASKRAAKAAMANQSLNHLLNFTLPPRQHFQALPRRSRKTGTQQGVWNKEKFVNAQYRFIMKPNGDYTVHFADPDIFFQWTDILQVIVPRYSALAAIASGSSDTTVAEEGHTTCPICLSPPTAARMTKCGHVFCFPCILHYLTTSEHVKWARCPICFDSVSAHQLKSVKWQEESELDRLPATDSADVGPTTTLRMRLMQRPQITTLALPRSATWPSDAVQPHQAPFHFLPDVFPFSKFMLATPDYILSELSRELDQLAEERRIHESMNDDLSVNFVVAAEEKVRRQMAMASELETAMLVDSVQKAKRDVANVLDNIKRHEEQQAMRTHDAAVPEEVPDAFLAVSAPPAPTPQRLPKQRKNLNPPPPPTSAYYFYQSASGAQIFLHPLDIRILLSHFRSYADFPDTIALRVEAAQAGTVNDDLRKRCKYLAHLPEGADVVFVETDLAGVVPPEGLAPFESALRTRRARRRERVRKDDKARTKAEEREREKLALSLADTPAARTLMGAESLREVHDAEDEQDEPPVEPPAATPAPVAPGAWGARSFAGVLHAAPQRRSVVNRREDDDADFDGAWEELEQRSGGQGRKGRKTKLVLLGSGGGGAPRRR